MEILTRGWDWQASIQIWLAIIVVATLVGSSLIAAIAWVRRSGLWSLLGLACFLAGGLFWAYLGSLLAQQLFVSDLTGATLVATRWFLLVASLASFLLGSILAWMSRGVLLDASALAFVIVGQACTWMFFGSSTPHSAVSDPPTLLVVCLLSLLAFIGGGILAWLSLNSFIAALALVVERVAGLIRDLASLSPRRLWALAWHNVRESVRRRMLLAILAVFLGLFLFAGWYLPSRPTEQVKVYVSFVLMASTLIAMVGCGLLACLSLPIDIREQTIHTVVTKPVRRLEIVVGRMLGLTLVASAILGVMGVVSYGYLARSSYTALVRLRGELATAQDKRDDDRERQLKDDIEQIESKLIARVPIFGKLAFLDNKGELKPAGVSVGNESTYRSYIEGNRPSAAIWRFTGLPTGKFIARKEIPLEVTFTAFRTLKAQMTQEGRLTGVLAEMTYRNPHQKDAQGKPRQIKDYPFELREYYVNRQALRDNPADPQKSLAYLLEGCNGDLEIEVRCLSPAQYLGMAQPDLYVMLESASFAGNFAKGMAGVWLRVFLIICVAVTASTFLSAPVALLVTLAVFVGAQCMDFLRKLAMAAESIGGGPLEAARRLITHDNLQRQLDPGFWTQVIQSVDGLLRFILLCLTYVLPDLGQLNTAPLVANGFDISGALLVQSLVTAFGYAVPFTVLGYLMFQSREIAR